jgi:hypothetical protein
MMSQPLLSQALLQNKTFLSELAASKAVTGMMSQPLLSQALLQNKTFLSELARADPGTLNTIMGLLNGLLDASIAASIAFTTDVSTASTDVNAKAGILATATTAQTKANDDKTAADTAFTKATSDFDLAVIHHNDMKAVLAAKQPGVDAESDILRRTIALVQTLLPPVYFVIQDNTCAEKGAADVMDGTECKNAAVLLGIVSDSADPPPQQSEGDRPHGCRKQCFGSPLWLNDKPGSQQKASECHQVICRNN